MGVFSRIADIINANVTSILDKAEDPAKMIRLIIQEMEDTLVEVRSTSARVLAEKKDLTRKIARLEATQQDWQDKAELALRKEREDLAKAALLEKQKLNELKEALDQELVANDEALTRLSSEITQLEQKLQETRAKQKSIELRHRAANGRLDVKKQLDGQKVARTMERFDQFERRIDELNSKADSYEIGGKPELKDEFAELQADDEISQQLAELKKKINNA
ncbi:phage shock protein PspA [Motilimonas cestriensis]|uniref:Phage shock protein PspA n=1 Tax=Motilimonas cestriensis TaxID=2742685 RepID=A0ABS8WA60_9GAMM|nr:phage shock protein PspA [Motilimonas cestriensis]MCE2595375.1 phage shock protein PspA [Motilimonas cestriensis]